VTLTVETEDGTLDAHSETIHVLDAIVVPVMYSTIQEAIDFAKNGDTVVVLPGTYEVSVAIRRKRITLQSTNPEESSSVEQTILSPIPNTTLPIVTIAEDSSATVAGFTIRDSPGCASCTSGAVFVREASPTIRDNHFINNTDGSILAFEASAKITGNTFLNNHGTFRGLSGAAIHGYNCRRGLTITSNIFRDNSAKSGGAIYLASSCADLTPGIATAHFLSSNLFERNTATEFGGGAIFVEYGARLNSDTLESTNTFQANSPNDVFYVVPPE